MDYNFYQVERSSRATLSIGVDYTQMRTSDGRNDSLQALSLYPQLTLSPVRDSLHRYYFFVRALGPTFISSNQLGDRRQDHHFAFQAQVGVGYKTLLSDNTEVRVQLSWKHFSNANLFDDNDGIDLPFLISIGVRF